MDAKTALTIAQGLLDNEFEEVNRRPDEYCESLGWVKNGAFGTAEKAVEKAGTLCPDANDYNELAAIIENSDAENSLEAAELNAVSDFLCNCVAKHILVD